MTVVHQSILNQYLAALGMLAQAVESCPEDLWTAPEHRNPFWHIAYHAAFYTYFYVGPSEIAFPPWTKHTPGSNFLIPPGEPQKADHPYTKADILEYLALCRAELQAKVPELQLDQPSGFHWLPFNKLELQLYSLRHLQHHIGQLSVLLRAATGVGVKWMIKI